MKQIAWAIMVIGVLLAGSALSAEAGAGPAGGVRGGGGGVHGAGPGWTGGGGSRGGTPGGGGGHGHGPGWGGAYRVGGPYPYRYGGPRVYIGGGVGWWGSPGWWGYPGWWGGAPYPYYSGGQSVVIEQAPTEYIQQDPAPPSATQYWYYCQNAGAYYPYVQDCPGGWMQVVPSPNPPDR